MYKDLAAVLRGDKMLPAKAAIPEHPALAEKLLSMDTLDYLAMKKCMGRKVRVYSEVESKWREEFLTVNLLAHYFRELAPGFPDERREHAKIEINA